MHDSQKKILRDLLSEVIQMEELMHPDWHKIDSKIDVIWEYITHNNLDGDVDRDIIKYLDDGDIRKNDIEFGNYQREYYRNISSKTLDVSDIVIN